MLFHFSDHLQLTLCVSLSFTKPRYTTCPPVPQPFFRALFANFSRGRHESLNEREKYHREVFLLACTGSHGAVQSVCVRDRVYMMAACIFKSQILSPVYIYKCKHSQDFGFPQRKRNAFLYFKLSFSKSNL